MHTLEKSELLIVNGAMYYALHLGVNTTDLVLGWCAHLSQPTPVEVLRRGLMPFKPDSYGIFIESELIRFLSCMVDYSPASSVSVMAAVLTSLGQVQLCRIGVTLLSLSLQIDYIEQDVLRRDSLIGVMNQWRRLVFEEKKLVQRELFVCPSCPGGGHCVHLDGNFKLYRYINQGR